MELRQLRHFVAVAECRNFSEASTHLYLSQPALTRSIQQLERDVGAPLLNRAASGVGLTPAGERFLDFARMIIAECGRASLAVRAVHVGAVGTVVVGMGALYSEHVMELVVLRCRRDAPGIDLRTVSAATHELETLVRDGAVDFAFTSFTREQPDSGLVHEPLLTLTDVLLAEATHPLAQRRSLDASELGRAPWVVINRPQSLDAYARYFTARGMPVPRAIRTNSAPLILGLVRNHGFLTFLPRPVVAAELRRGALRALPIEGAEATRDAGLLYCEQHVPTAAAARVMSILREVCATPTATRGKARKRQRAGVKAARDQA